jgi:hypothetical protein
MRCLSGSNEEQTIKQTNKRDLSGASSAWLMGLISGVLFRDMILLLAQRNGALPACLSALVLRARQAMPACMSEIKNVSR